MNRWMRLCGVVALFGFGATLALAQEGKKEEPKKEEAKKPAAVNCAACTKPANLAISAEADSGPVFFCCPTCKEAYGKDAAKCAKGVEDQQKALADRAKVHVRCPLDGMAVDGKVTSEKGGIKASFCCEACKTKYDADPAKYKKAAANSFTYQTLCPVTGKGIDPKGSVKLPGGETVYFCCDKCPAKYTADPAKYSAALVAQGYTIDTSKAKPEEKKAG